MRRPGSPGGVHRAGPKPGEQRSLRDVNHITRHSGKFKNLLLSPLPAEALIPFLSRGIVPGQQLAGGILFLL